MGGEGSKIINELPKKKVHLKDSARIYCQEFVLKGAPAMYESNDPNADLEDLLFCEEDGHPSDR